ncbi:RecX family transcriptional regulator [Candidatus Saccharibacteria bacterium]|nr:RecX family transcriptional regulator [Candidatus Saccharibacteria bacterium]
MKITAIKPQVKREGRYSIFVDDAYSFSLSADALLGAKLTVGIELEEAEVRRYKKLSADDKAYNLALAYVARRMRSEGELRDYFKRKKYDPELAEQLLAKLRSVGFVDDYEFATRWVQNRRQLKATSTRRLALELRQKHIGDDIIQRVLDEDETDEHVLLKELIAKKRSQTRYQDDQKLIAYLARQGFSYGDIKSALVDDEI